MIYFLLYYGYKIGMSGTSFSRAITDTVIQWNEFWAKLMANLKDFALNFTMDRIDEVWTTFSSLEVVSGIITTASTIGIVFIFIKYAWGVFRYYSIQLDEGVSPLTIEYIKKTVFSMLFVFLAPYIIINGFYLTTVVTSYAVSQITHPDGKTNVTEDLLYNHLSFQSYCGDNVNEASVKDNDFTNAPPMNNVLTQQEYEIITNTGYKKDDNKDVETMENKKFGVSSLTKKYSDIATYTMVHQKEGQIAYPEGPPKFWEESRKNMLINEAHINRDSSKGPIGAVMITKNGRNYFLVATSTYFGVYKDTITITLANGKQFYGLIFDTKNMEDDGSHADIYGNKIYHGGSKPNLLEFEVEQGVYNESSGNVLNDSWFGSGDKSVVRITNEMTITDEELDAAFSFDMADMFKDGDIYVGEKYNTLWSSADAAVSAGYAKNQYTGKNMGELYKKYCSSFTIKNADGSNRTVKPLRVYQSISMQEDLSIQTSISFSGVISGILIVIFGIITMLNMGVRLAELLVLLMMTPFFGMQYISVRQSYALKQWGQELTSLFMSHAVSVVLFYVFIVFISSSENLIANLPILFGLVVVQLRGPSALRAWSHNTGTFSLFSSLKKGARRNGG